MTSKNLSKKTKKTSKGSYKQIYKEKNKRYLFSPSGPSAKSRRMFDNNVDPKNVEHLFMKDINVVAGELGLGDGAANVFGKKKTDKEIKEMLDAKVTELYIHFLFTRDLKYLEELSVYTIPPILSALKGYKKYFMNGTDFPDLIQYVVYNVTEEFKCLKWSVGKGGFMTFIFPRVKKFIQEFLKTYQRENEDMGRTFINDEQNYAIITEMVKGEGAQDGDIVEHIMGIKVEDVDPHIISEKEYQKVFDNMSIEMQDGQITKMSTIGEHKYLLNLGVYFEKFQGVINKSNVVGRAKSKKSTITTDDLKRVFIFLLKTSAFDERSPDVLVKKIGQIVDTIKKEEYYL